MEFKYLFTVAMIHASFLLSCSSSNVARDGSSGVTCTGDVCVGSTAGASTAEQISPKESDVVTSPEETDNSSKEYSGSYYVLSDLAVGTLSCTYYENYPQGSYEKTLESFDGISYVTVDKGNCPDPYESRAIVAGCAYTLDQLRHTTWHYEDSSSIDYEQLCKSADAEYVVP